MTRQELINQSTGCIRANADTARRIMKGWQTQHRVLAKSKNNPFRVGEIYWIREPGRVQTPIKHTDSPLWGWATVRYTDDEGLSIRVPERMRESRWFLESQGIPNGIFKEAARTFVKINRAWREPVQEISEEDAKLEGVTCCIWFHRHGTDDVYDINLSLDAINPVHPSHGKRHGISYRNGFATLFDSIYPGAWDRNEDVWACEFELVEVTE